MKDFSVAFISYGRRDVFVYFVVVVRLAKSGRDPLSRHACMNARSTGLYQSTHAFGDVSTLVQQLYALLCKCFGGS